MVDTPTNAFEKKVIIALESTMHGVQNTLLALERMKKHLGDVQKTTKEVDKATESLSRTYTKAAKDINRIKTGFKGLKTVQKGLYETMRRVGNITKTALGIATAAVSAFFIESKRVGNTMLQFEVSSLDAADALNRLGSAYGKLHSQASTAVLSMQDIASELTKFQHQGVAQMSATMNEEFMKGWLGLQSSITQVLGKTDASELMGTFVRSLGDEFRILRKTLSGDLRIITEQIESALDPQIKAGYIDEAIAKIKDLRIYTNDQAATAQVLIGVMTRLREATLGGGNKMTQVVVAMNVAWAKLGRQVENFSTGLIETFGPDLARMINKVAGRLQKDMGGILNRLSKYAQELKNRFVAWGGTAKLIEKLQRALDLAYKALAKIVSVGSGIISWLIEANDATKILAGGLAAMVLAPGLLTSVITLSKGLRMVSIEAAGAAAAAKGLTGFGAAKGFAAVAASRASGYGLLAGVATVGHLGGKAVADIAGVEEGGMGETLAAAVGAAAAGAAIGSVVPVIGTAVGAAVAGIGSLIVSGIQSWRTDAAEAAGIKADYYDKERVASEKSIRILKQQIKSLEQYAVSSAQNIELKMAQVNIKIEQKRQDIFSGKLTEIDAAPALDRLRNDLDKAIEEKRELGLYKTGKDEAYIKRILEAEKKREVLTSRARIAQGKAQGDLVKEMALQSSSIKKLKEAGKLQFQINELLKEREDILKKPDTSEAKRTRSAQIVQANIDKLQSEKLELEVAIDPRGSIGKVMAQVKTLQEIQAEEGFDFKSDAYIEAVRRVRKSYNELKSGLTQIEGGQLDEQIEQLDIVFDKTLATGDSFAVFIGKLEELKAFSARTLPGFTAALSGMGAVIDTLGPATEIFGKQLSDIIQRTAIEEMSHSFEVLRQSALAAADIQKKIDLAKSPEDAARWTLQLSKAMDIAAAATKTLQQSLEANLKPLQKQAELIGAIKDLRQLDLDISQQLYGTPALAVQAQLELVKVMQTEKENLEAQLSTVQSQIDLAKQLKFTEKDIFMFRMKELELSKKIKGVTRDQLRQVKELRDGYISALSAQALGAGRFQKVLITQEQSLGRGLLKGAVKANYLLGQAGAAAGASRADPYRFSAQGMGFLETLSGQTMTPEDISKAVYERVANISDPLAKASALQSADIFMNIMSGADKNTKDLGNIFTLGMTQNADRVVDAISAFAEQRLPRAAAGLALKGAPAGETLFGAAQDRYGRGLPFPPPATGIGGLPLDSGLEGLINKLKELKIHAKDGGVEIQELIGQLESQFVKSVQFDAAIYRKQVAQQGGSQDSIRALIEHYGQTRDHPTKTLLGPNIVSRNEPLNDMSKNLYADLMKSFDIQMKILDVKGKNKGKLEADLNKINDAIEFRSNELKSEFGDQGFNAVGNALKRFDQTITDKAATKVEILTDQISKLIGGDIRNVPEAQDKLKKLRQERSDLIADFSIGDTSKLKETNLMEQSRKATEEQIKQIQRLSSDTEQLVKRFSSHPALAGMPTLTAVDTDEFMGKKKRKSIAQELQREYGPRSRFMADRIKTISKIDERIKKIGAKIIPDLDEEKMGPPTRKQERERKQQERFRRQQQTLEKARKKQIAALDRVREAVDRPKREQARVEEQSRRDRAAAEAAMGLSYVGDAPERVKVDKTGYPILEKKITSPWRPSLLPPEPPIGPSESGVAPEPSVSLPEPRVAPEPLVSLPKSRVDIPTWRPPLLPPEPPIGPPEPRVDTPLWRPPLLPPEPPTGLSESRVAPEPLVSLPLLLPPEPPVSLPEPRVGIPPWHPPLLPPEPPVGPPEPRVAPDPPVSLPPLLPSEPPMGPPFVEPTAVPPRHPPVLPPEPPMSPLWRPPLLPPEPPVGPPFIEPKAGPPWHPPLLPPEPPMGPPFVEPPWNPPLLPPDLPKTGPIEPGTIRGKQAPIKKRVGVGDPTRIRQLAHGISGDVHQKGRKVKQLMQEAGQLVESISQDVEAVQSNQDNITQYAGNRLFNVQAVSPT